MKLFNKTIDRQLFKQYPLGSDLSKQEVVVKIFNPSANGTWFILNSDPNDPDYLWAIVDLGYGAEVGSVSRSDLETYRGRFGLGFERDLSFDPINAEELYEGLSQGKLYGKGGNLSRDRKFVNHSQEWEVEYSKGKNRHGYGFADGGEVSFIEYKDSEIIYEPNYDKYYANDVEFDSLKEAQDFIDSGETDARICDAYSKGLFENGGEIDVVYERRADFKKKPVTLLLLNKGKEQKGFTFSGKDQVAVLNNYNRNNQEDLEKLWNLKGYESKYAEGGSLEDVLKQDISFLRFDSHRAYDSFKRLDIPHLQVHDYDFNHYSIIKTENLETVLSSVKKGIRVVKKKFTVDDIGYDYKGRTAFADGGNIESFSDNQRMIMNQNVELEHHHEELEDILEDKIEVPAWVVAKMATATDSVSAITHYLDGEKELIEDEKENMSSSEFFPVEDEDDDDNVNNLKVVEPINVSAGTKAEMTKKFTEDAWGNLKGFLKGMERIELRDDYTFDYKGEQFEIEPIINSDENGVSNAVFTIFDGDGEEQGEMTYSREGGKQKFTANSELFSWNNTKFEDGGGVDDYLNKMQRGEGYRYDTIYLPKDLKEEVENFIKQGYNELVDDGKGKLYLLNEDSEIGKSFEVSEKEDIQAIMENFSKQKDSFADGGRTNRILKEGDVVKFKTVLGRENPKSRYVVLEIAYDSEPQRALIQILGSNFSIVPTEKVRISDLEFVSESKYANGGSFKKVKWQDVEIGDSARVKEINRMGLIIKTYGKKFHLKFPNGTEKTFDASELEFFKSEKDEYEMDDNNNFAKGGSLEDKLTKLESKKSDLESKLFDAQQKSNAVMNNIGFGAGMRRSKVSFSTSREYSLKERIKVVEKEIEQTKEDMLPKKPKYILKADIKTVTVKRNGKEVTYKGADVLNGANVLATGGDISSKANYIPKRDVVEVELKDGSKVKPVNGYWVKKGAEAITSKQEFTSKDLPKNGSSIEITAPKISSSPAIDLVLKYDFKNYRFDVYKDGVKKDIIGEKEVLNNLNSGIYVFSNKSTPTSSSSTQSKVSTTQIRKDARGNWRAETNIDNFNGYDWRISTVKTYSGNLVSSAQGGKTEESGTKGIVMFKYTIYEDPNHTLEVSKPKRLTDKVVSEQHDKALAKFKKYMETGMFKGGGQISNFDKLSAKVAKNYEGKPVKSQYQEEYGKYYSKEEAQEVGDKVAGKMKAMQTEKKIFGGLFGKEKESSDKKAKALPNLAKEQVTLKSGDIVQVFSQDGSKLQVLSLEMIGTGVKPHTIDISEVDPSSYELGGNVDKKIFGGLFGKSKESSSETKKSIPNLAKKEVTLKSGDIVQVFSQDGDKIEVLSLEKMGSGVRPHIINISEVDPTSYKLGGSTAKKSNSGIETLKQANELAKKIRKKDESWLDAKKRAFALLKK